MDTISSVSYSRACGLVLTSARGHRITFDEDVAGFMLAYSPDTPSKLPEVGAPWQPVVEAASTWCRWQQAKQNDLWYAAGGRREVRDVTPNPYQQRRCAGPLVADLYGGCSLDCPSFAPQRSTPPTAPSWRHLTSHGGTKHEDGSILLGLARRQADSGPAHDPRSCSQTHPTLALRSAIHTDGTPRFRVADLSGAIHRRRGHDGDSHMKEAVSIWSILAMVAIVIGSGVAETIATRFLQ